MPIPRASIFPTMLSGADAINRPSSTSSTQRSSATSVAPSAIISSDSHDFPEPDGPRINIPLPFTLTQLAWMTEGCDLLLMLIWQQHQIGIPSTKRAPSGSEEISSSTSAILDMEPLLALVCMPALFFCSYCTF